MTVIMGKKKLNWGISKKFIKSEKNNFILKFLMYNIWFYNKPLSNTEVISFTDFLSQNKFIDLFNILLTNLS